MRHTISSSNFGRNHILDTPCFQYDLTQLRLERLTAHEHGKLRSVGDSVVSVVHHGKPGLELELFTAIEFGYTPQDTRLGGFPDPTRGLGSQTFSVNTRRNAQHDGQVGQGRCIVRIRTDLESDAAVVAICFHFGLDALQQGVSYR